MIFEGKIAGITACIQTNGYKSSGIVFHRLENYDEERKVYIDAVFSSLNIVEWKKKKKKKKGKTKKKQQ